MTTDDGTVGTLREEVPEVPSCVLCADDSARRYAEVVSGINRTACKKLNAALRKVWDLD